MDHNAVRQTALPGRPVWLAHRRLRPRILSWHGMATLVVFAVVTLGVSWFTFQNEQTSWQARQAEAASHAADVVADSLRHSDETLTLLGALGPQLLTEEPGIMQLLAGQHPSVLEAVYLDQSARPVVSASVGQPLLDPRNAAGAPWFHQAASGLVYRGPVQFSASNEPYFVAAAPVANGGVVVARFGLLVLSDLGASMHFGRTGHVYVVDADGQVIIESGSPATPVGTNIQGRLEFAAITAAPSHEWIGSYADSSGQEVTAITRAVDGSSWIVVSEVSQTETTETSRVALLLLLAGLLALEIAATMVIRRALLIEVFQPLTLLGEGARRIGNGDLDHRIPVRQWDEIGQVADAFNAMARHLYQQRTALEHSSKEMEAVYQIGLSLTANLDLQPLAEVVLQATFQLLPDLHDCYIFLYEQDRISFVASLFSDGRRNLLISEPRPNGLTYSVARGGKMILVPDVSVHPLYQDPVMSFADGAIAGIPLKIGSRVVGVMNTAYSRAHGFSDRDLHVLQLIADQAAIAVENARLYGQVQRELRERELAQDALAQSQARYRAIVEGQAEYVCRFTPDGKITFANAACRRALNLPAEGPTGASLFDFLPRESIEKLAKLAEGLSPDNPVLEVELRVVLPGGRVAWHHWTARAIYDALGNCVEYQGTGRDVTERVMHQEEIQRLNWELENRVAERTGELEAANRSLHAEIAEHSRADLQIRASLREKDLLLKEIHHRVKNNLQIIASLLNLQSSKLEDHVSQEILRDSQNRVRSMAMIHERLYRSRDMNRVDMGEYVRGLTASLFRSYRIDTDAVTLDVHLDEDVSISIDAAIPCGLIINELVSNALKHAFPNGRRGRLEVNMVATPNGLVSLTVADDGVGIPDSLDWRNTESLGLQLVITLVDQLEGNIELQRGGGASFRIAFATTRP